MDKINVLSTRAPTVVVVVVVVVVVALGVLVAARPADARGPFVESRCKHGLAETVKRLQAAARKQGWKIPKVYDLQGALRKARHEVRPVKVVSLCKPDLAVKILGRDALRSASVMMPCRISIYERADGKTYLSRLDPSAFGGPAAKVMAAAARELEALIKPLVKPQLH
jgi:uncharacterized protein (DUF302 family)